jgi:hypothetical protein
MRRFICALVVGLTFALAASLSHAAARPVNNLNEPGSLLAYPLITPARILPSSNATW